MHESVLLTEAIDALNLKDNSIAVDMTLGFAGHSSQILKRIVWRSKYICKLSKEKCTSCRSRFDLIVVFKGLQSFFVVGQYYFKIYFVCKYEYNQKQYTNKANIYKHARNKII